MAKKASGATRTLTKHTKKGRRKSAGRKATKKPVTRRAKALKATRTAGRLPSPPVVRARRPARRGPSGRLAAAPETTAVTMAIDFNPFPGDVLSIRRIDGKALAGVGASVSEGGHTAGWDVVSPTVRPIEFDVTITQNATGKKLLYRPGQKTGNDGKGSGAGTFSV